MTDTEIKLVYFMIVAVFGLIGWLTFWAWRAIWRGEVPRHREYENSIIDGMSDWPTKPR